MDVKPELVALSEHVFERTRRRLDGLSDPEYFWEPVPGCWSIRIEPGPRATADWADGVDDPPFTTVAWRLWHLTSNYGDARNELWLRGSDDGGGEGRCAPRTSAAAAVDALDAAHDWWKSLLASLTEKDLATSLGAVAGPYGDASRASYVLHQIDEMIHHGAELGVLRDLYAARGS